MEWVENIVYVLVHYIDRLIPWEQLYEVVADGYIDRKLTFQVLTIFDDKYNSVYGGGDVTPSGVR